MITTTDRTSLSKTFHVLLGKAGIDHHGKLTLLGKYGAVSSKDISIDELSEICNGLEIYVRTLNEQNHIPNPDQKEMDIWRKRVIAVISAYIKFVGKEYENTTAKMNAIKGIACRASGHSPFNDIPKAALRDVYNAFVKTNKVMERSFHEMERMFHE